MVLGCQHDVFGARCLKDLCPLRGIPQLRRELWRVLLVSPTRRLGCVHESAVCWVRRAALPFVPEPFSTCTTLGDTPAWHAEHAPMDEDACTKSTRRRASEEWR